MAGRDMQVPAPALAPAAAEALAAAAAPVREAIVAARGLDTLAAAARAIVPLGARVLAASDDVEHITALLRELNDLVTVRVVQAVAEEMGADLDRACWLAFGSQARGEQTLVSDQDNGLVFVARGNADAERTSWLAFGQRVNEALAACGYALCDGRVMAGQPPCCLTPDEWRRRFEHWLAHGSANDLLAARIYFDLRPLAGRQQLAEPLAALLCSPAAAVPRFVKCMADVVLCNHVPLNWIGKVVTTRHHDRAAIDLKMSGSALFVDAARLWALAHGIAATATVPRLRAAARALHVPDDECQAWVRGFLALLRLRLQVQARRGASGDPEDRAWAAWDDLDDTQRRELVQALKAARWVQQRIALDYRR